MIGYELEGLTGEQLVRFVKTLGQHRYVASRMHLVHAFAMEASNIPEASAWATRAIESGVIDLASKDERLFRRANDAELVSVLEGFWSSDRGHARLRERLAAAGVTIEGTAFDEASEAEMFPVLIDAGWELLPLSHLTWEKHKGAMQSFEDWEVARFEEENAIPPIVTLHELPQLGAVELLEAFDADGKLTTPFVLWQDGNETYLDYVLRGILRASKLEESA